MKLGEMELENAAQEARGDWQEFDSFGWHDRPEEAEDWAISIAGAAINAIERN